MNSMCSYDVLNVAGHLTRLVQGLHRARQPLSRPEDRSAAYGGNVSPPRPGRCQARPSPFAQVWTVVVIKSQRR